MAGTEQKAVKNARIYPQICSHGGPPGFFFPGLLQSQYRSHNFLELRANTSFPRNSVRRTVAQLSMWGTIKYVMVTVKWRTSAESLISTWSNVRWIRHRPLFCFNSPSQASTQTFSPQAYRPILNAGQTCYASWHLGRWSLTLPGWNSWQEVSDPHGPHSQTLIGLRFVYLGLGQHELLEATGDDGGLRILYAMEINVVFLQCFINVTSVSSRCCCHAPLYSREFLVEPPALQTNLWKLEAPYGALAEGRHLAWWLLVLTMPINAYKYMTI